MTPLAEAPVPTDLWISAEAQVVSYPAISNDLSKHHATFLVSGVAQGVRAPNPEIPGGHIARVATNNNRVQTPPSSLDRMHACRHQQVAFNRRILKNEEQISGISVGLGDFLQGMSMEVHLVACVSVSVGGRMRGTQPLCGELWQQEGRQMTASCLSFDGLGKSREEVALSGVADVLPWRNALETRRDPNFLRPGQRVVVCPKFLDELDAILSSGDIGFYQEQCIWPAYEGILKQSLTWPIDKRPVMLPEGDRLPSQRYISASPSS
jgi:hypothetical protein